MTFFPEEIRFAMQACVIGLSAAILGCDAPTSATPEEPISAADSTAPVINNVVLNHNPNPTVPLAAILSLSTDEPAEVTVRVDDGERVWDAISSEQPATEHSLIVLGLRAGRTHSITAVAVDASGNTSNSRALALETPPLPDAVPRPEVLISQPGRMEPGVTLFNVIRTGDDGEAVVTIHTEPVDLTVTSVLAGAEQAPRLQEVAEPMPAPPRVGRLLLIAALAIVAAGLAAAVVVIVRRRAARRAARAAIVPPHEAALHALRELAADDLLHRDLLAFHTAVAAIVRRYLEQRFGVRAPERTTEELMFILNGGSWLDDPQRRALHAFLAQCDQVKFARARPTAVASQDLLDTATDLVQATTPPAPEPEPEPDMEAARAV